MDQSPLSSRAIIGMYYARQETAPGLGWVDGVSNLFNSDQVGERYEHLGASPVVREWIGGRQPKSLRNLPAFEIKNVHFEASLFINRADARRDKTGQIEARIADLYDQTMADWSRRLGTKIAAGAATLCYDGQYYFSATHSEGESGTQSNKIDVDISALPVATHGTATNPSKEEMQQMIVSGIAKILGFKNDRGVTMNTGARSFVVLAPVSLYIPAVAAVTQSFNSALQGNINPNLIPGMSIDVAMVPELDWTDSIAVFRTDAMTKGLIRQRETEWELKAIAEGSELEAMDDKWMFGVDSWRNADFGYWQRACKVTAI